MGLTARPCSRIPRWSCTRWVWLFIGVLIIIYLKIRYYPLAPFGIAYRRLMLTQCPPCCSPQPVHLSSELEGLLLGMCEDVASRRTDLLTVLEACELHHRASMLPPAERLIRQLVEEVYRNSVSIGLFSCMCLLGLCLVIPLFLCGFPRAQQPSPSLCRLTTCLWLKMDLSLQIAVKWSGTDYTVRSDIGHMKCPSVDKNAFSHNKSTGIVDFSSKVGQKIKTSAPVKMLLLQSD